MPLLNQSVLKVNTRGGPPVELHVPTWPIKPYVPNCVFYKPETPEHQQGGQEDLLDEDEEEHNQEKQGAEEEEGQLDGTTRSGDRSPPAE